MPMQAIAATKFTVHGRVQGVGFRWSTRRVAGELNLAGWARNRPDGSVEAWAQGSRRALEELRFWPIKRFDASYDQMLCTGLT